MAQLYEEINTIPFEEITDTLSRMNYASPERVMFEILAITGCRISELDKMNYSQLYDDLLVWSLGKNQRRSRKENLPVYLVNEIKEMRSKYRCSSKLFPISSSTFVRYFNRDVRPKLSPSWIKKRTSLERKTLKEEYVYRLKLLRKNYQTLLFKKYLDKFEGHYDIALQFTSKRMRHSSTKMTAYYYLQGIDDIKNFSGLMPEEIIRRGGGQKRLVEFF